MKTPLAAWLCALTLLASPVRANDPVSGAPDPQRSPAAPAVDAAPDSVAEQVTRLARSIEADEARLEELKGERDDPDGEYARARAEFDEIDAELEAQTKARKDLAVDDAAGRAAADREIARLEKARTLAEERFNLAIEDRKVSAEQIANLEKKLQRDRKALDKLEGREAPEPAAPAEAEPAVDPAGSTGSSKAGAPETAAPATPTTAPASPAAATATPEAPHPGEEDARPASQELVEAQQEVQARTAASKEADEEAKSITERLEGLDAEIGLEQKLLATARKQQANATEDRREQTAAFRERSLAGAPRDELDALLTEVHEIEERVHQSGDAVREHAERLEELQTERAALQAEQIDALKKAEEAREQVEEAEADIRRLENPFSPRNMLLWAIDHGPRMLTVLVAMLIGHWVSRLFSQRVVRLLSHSGARGSSVEREARARTLVGVCHNAMSMVIFVGGGLMILQEAGIPIAPLLGGAAVFGLAVAFGAQNLIRDYFYGFVILLENQYKLNDVVKIGELSGQVEKITLRMTVLRDLEGQAHFLPNGAITAVTNKTHGWSRAVFEIGVSYKEDVDQVMAVLMALAHELRSDPAIGPMIVEDATMLGVDALADSAVVIKFHIKTLPLQQWAVKRELLRRIKNRFDELGIEIPFPQRTVHHRADPGTSTSTSPAASPRILHGSREVRADAANY